MKTIIAAIVTMAGCTSFDFDVVPSVEHAQITVDRTAPTTFSMIDVTVQLVAGSHVDHDVTVRQASLRPVGGEDTDLHLAFPGEGMVSMGGGETVSVDLVNIGTTNAVLTPLCDTNVLLELGVGDPNDPNAWILDTDPPTLTVGCT